MWTAIIFSELECELFVKHPDKKSNKYRCDNGGKDIFHGGISPLQMDWIALVGLEKEFAVFSISDEDTGLSLISISNVERIQEDW